VKGERTAWPPRVRRLIAAALLVAGCAAAAETIWVVLRSRQLYAYVSAGTRGWRGRVHGAAPELGFAPIPGARGAHVFPIGPEIPMRYDSEGFRVPVDGPDVTVRRRPLVLALGGSFTYADACRAEDAFVYRVAEGLGGTAVNAGVPSWGLASVLIRARREIPRLKPDVVLVQYSYWLLDRAVTPMAPSYAGRLPMPYFADGAGGELVLAPPVFLTRAFDVPLSEYARQQPGTSRYLSFLARVAGPLLVHDDLQMLRLRARLSLGGVPQPTRDVEAVVRLVYGEILELSRAAGARVRVVLLTDSPGSVVVPEALARLEIPMVDAQAALMAGIDPTDGRAYGRAYWHWRGDPPRLVDGHPNPRAHQIVADAVLGSLLP
jgi:hypothetical protein